jgi:hypothetical protein
MSLDFRSSLLVPLFLISSTNLELKIYIPSSTSKYKVTAKTPFSKSPSILA